MTDLRDARLQKAFYDEQLIDVKKDLAELFSDNESIEKFAREKFFMKKDDEEIFIIINN